MQNSISREEQYLTDRWQKQRDYYSKRARQNKRWHRSLLLFSTISAIIVPVLLNIPNVPKLYPTILSVLVSAAIALENVYHFGDNWHTFRQALEALKQEKVFLEARVEPYDDPQTAFPIFVNSCENIMNVEGHIYHERNRSKAHPIRS